jgi:rod shape-determining protein MreB
MALFKKNVALDLGTVNVVIYVAGQGITLREPAVAAVSNDKYREVLAVGTQARAKLAKLPGGAKEVYPVKEGVINDFLVAEEMISYFLAKALKRRTIIGAGTSVVVGVPCSVSEKDKQTVQKAIKNAGAKEVVVAEQPMLAAIGAGLPIKSPVGSMVVDIGGGTTEIAIVSLSEIVVSRSIRIGGTLLDHDIAYYVRKKYDLAITDKVAEQIKIEFASALDIKDMSSINVRGRNAYSGVPESVELTSREVCAAISNTVDSIVIEIRALLEHISPEIAADVLENGITLTGGGALLNGMAERIINDIGIPAKVARTPLDSVALGAGVIAEQLEDLKKSRGIR